MSMLAGPKRKQKWTLNPRGKHWSEDSNKFGQKMLEKMGWTHGKGLGAKEQGSVEHIRVKVKNDQVGIGFDKNRDDQWTEHQDVFNSLLQNLQKEQNTEVAEENDKVLSGKSLEEKSKQSQKRVHYKKFTRGKDVNKYSTKDLANIFGKRDLNEKSVKEEKVGEDEEVFYDPIGTKDMTAGILTIKGGNMSDYFQKKLHADDQNQSSQDKNSTESESEQRSGFGFSVKSKSKFYVNDNTDPNEDDSNSEIGKYAGFGFTKSTDVKSKGKSMNNLNYVFDNPCLDLNILDDSPAKKIKTEVFSSEFEEKVTPRKRKSEFMYDNGGLDLNCPDKPTPKKRKNEVVCEDDILERPTPKKAKRNKNKPLSNVYENPALNLDVSDKPTALNTTEENNLSNGIENPALDLDFPDRTTPKKTKKIKSEPVSSGIENPALDLNFPDKATPKKTKKIKSEPLSSGIENPALDLDFPDRPTPKKAKTIKSNSLSNGIENPALDLEFPDKPTIFNIKKENSLSNGIENPALDLDSSERPTPKKVKKIKSESLSSGIENPALDLDFPDQPTPKKAKRIKIEPSFNQYENQALELESSYKLTPKKIKQEMESTSTGIENPALDLEFSASSVPTNKIKRVPPDFVFENSVINYEADKALSTSDFEVTRPACGLQNNAFDASDEIVNRKRVTFNEHVEYNTDIIKKKKKKKKLDKYEVVSERSKKKRKAIEPSTFVNEALNEDIICAEEFDNEINEKRSKKGKRRKDRRISLLETIEEAPEDENSNETEIDQSQKSTKTNDVEVIGEFARDDVEIMLSKNSLKKKNKKKKNVPNSSESTRENCDLEESNGIYNDIFVIPTEDSKKKKKKNHVKKETNDEIEINNQISDYEKENIHGDRDIKISAGTSKEKKKKKLSDDDVISLEEFLNEENSVQTKSKLKKMDSETGKKKNDIEIKEENMLDENQFSYQKFKTTKQVMKSLFLKNPTLMFNGSNINEIKGYGVETRDP